MMSLKTGFALRLGVGALSLMVLCLAGSCVATFYLPGLAPVDYCFVGLSEEYAKKINCERTLPVYVNRLNSIKNAVPYSYSQFDFCRSDGEQAGAESLNLGQRIFGDKISRAPLNLPVQEQFFCEKICHKSYNTSTDIDKDQHRLGFLKKAIDLEYYQHWIVDNMPVTWYYPTAFAQEYCLQGFPIGCSVSEDETVRGACVMSTRMSQPGHYVFNHLDLVVKYYHPSPNKDVIRILNIEVEPYSLAHTNSTGRNPSCAVSEPMVLTSNQKSVDIAYTYSVIWQIDNNPDKQWSSRWDYILEASSMSDIQWFSIINSGVPLLCWGAALVMLIKRMFGQLKCCNFGAKLWPKRYQKELEVLEDMRWKLVYGGLFHPPRRAMMLSVCIGSGVHLCSSAAVVLFFACLGMLSPANRGALGTCALILYAVLGAQCGYVSTRFYKMFGGENWRLQALLAALFAPGVMMGFFLLMNVIFLAHGSSAATSWIGVLSLFGLWLCLLVPLSLLGSFLAFKRKKMHTGGAVVKTYEEAGTDFSCKSYLRSGASALLAGFLPFTCLFIPLFFILNSIWVHVIYNSFLQLLLSSTLALADCIICNLMMALLCLRTTDYRSWWGQSFLCGGFTGFYVFLFCIHHLLSQLELVGASSYVIYVLIAVFMSSLCFIAFGAVGCLGTFLAFRKLHQRAVAMEEKNRNMEEYLKEELFSTWKTS